MNYTERINLAIENAKIHKSKLTQQCLEIEGCSSQKIRHLLNNLICPNDRYLEIGCYKGSTSISALFGKENVEYFLIDNYSEFDSATGAENTKGEFLNNFTSILGYSPKNFFNLDCLTVDKSLIKDINVYLYDGKHDHGYHKQSLMYFYECLANEFIFCVDDWDSEWGVRDGTFDAIKELGLKVKHKVELPHGIVTDSKLALMDDKWWFGFAVFHLEKI